jgi:hypothetical protein
MATPVTNRGSGRPREVGLLIHPEENYGPLNRTVFYVPRFTRHLRRRLRSNMSFMMAWRSARRRMREYR